MRRLGPIITAALVVGVLLPAAFAAPVAAAPDRVPKVVFVVGPVGPATERYRVEARAAAAVARRFTPDVTEVYSPNATWPAVKAAIADASLVVYMGHGNGFPSRYRDSLYPPTQNGFGLNPVAGRDDTAHQYFGEGKVEDVHLAKNAVVLLHHLCYASGLSEPGLPEGTLEEAQERVDNFAAGFIQAGAAAVVAEAYMSPSRYVATILGSRRSLESMWLDAPTANGHAFAFESARSPGYIAQMDPENGASGFERSIVLREGLATADVRAGARGTTGPAGSAPAFVAPGPPSLVASGLAIRTPTIAGRTSVGQRANLEVPFKIAKRDRDRLPASLQASVRWDPIDVPTVPTQPNLLDPPTLLLPSAPPTELTLVTAEQAGSVVAPAALTIAKARMSMGVQLPPTPGRYRLTITLHDGTGVAYDEGTQRMLPSLDVRITGDPDGAILAAPAQTLAAGSRVSLPVRVANLGTAPWGVERVRSVRPSQRIAPPRAGLLIGHWVPLDDPTIALVAPTVTATLPAGLAPGTTVDAPLSLEVPGAPGDYLLVLDVLTPDHGSLAAAGVSPTIVRIKVVAGS